MVNEAIAMEPTHKSFLCLPLVIKPRNINNWKMLWKGISCMFLCLLRGAGICHSAYPQQGVVVFFFPKERELLSEVSGNLCFIFLILLQGNADFLADYFFLTESTDYFIFFDPTGKIYAVSLTDPSTKEVQNFQYNCTENQPSQKHSSR